MQSQRPAAPEWLIWIGGSVFVVVLAISAAMDPSIRWLHFFQAWMYFVPMFLCLYRKRIGYFIGIAAAGFWDYVNIFATSFFFNGLQQLVAWIHTGHVARPDLLIAVPAWFGNLAVVAGCLWAYFRLPSRSVRDLAWFVGALVVTIGFFALDMAIFQPRYLGLFPQLMHPRLPF